MPVIVREYKLHSTRQSAELNFNKWLLHRAMHEALDAPESTVAVHYDFIKDTDMHFE